MCKLTWMRFSEKAKLPPRIKVAAAAAKGRKKSMKSSKFENFLPIWW